MTLNARLRVLVADGHDECRWAMEDALRTDCEVVSTVADGRQLIHAAMSLLPDVIVSDISMPFLTGVQAMEKLHQGGYQIPFVLVSPTNFWVEDYIKMGAMAFVNKVDVDYDLLTAVLSASLGLVCVSRNAGPGPS